MSDKNLDKLGTLLQVISNLIWVGGSSYAFMLKQPIYGFGILTIWILFEILSKAREILYALEQLKDKK